MTSKPCVIFVLGPPGAGKGTQCTKISDKYGYTHLSAGDLLRGEVANNGPDGALIEGLISRGNIVPSSITVTLVQRAMASSTNNKFLIDGFPRNEENIRTWEGIIGDQAQVQFMLFYECSEDECVRRILSRNQGRSDDNSSVVRKRIQTYKSSTLPVIEMFRERGLVRVVDSEPDIDTVFASTELLLH